MKEYPYGPNVRGTLGEPELIDYTTADHHVVKRWMRPVLDGDGGWLRWVPVE